MAVTRELRINSYESMADANSQLMDEVFNDGKLTPAEKMKTFSIGVRNQIMLSRDLASRRAELSKHGMKPTGEIKELMFNPLASS